MKILNYFTAIVFVAIVSFTITACTDNPTENCEQQDMNEILNCGVEKNVEVCCETGASCVYTYNGTDYPDTQQGLNDLADALGCDYKSAEVSDSQKQLIIKNLIELKDKARLGNME